MDDPLRIRTNGKQAPFMIRPKALRVFLTSHGARVGPYPYTVPKDSTLTCDFCWNRAHEGACRGEDLQKRKVMEADLAPKVVKQDRSLWTPKDSP